MFEFRLPPQKIEDFRFPPSKNCPFPLSAKLGTPPGEWDLDLGEKPEYLFEVYRLEGRG